jgi:hypothetical protein
MCAARCVLHDACCAMRDARCALRDALTGERAARARPRQQVAGRLLRVVGELDDQRRPPCRVHSSPTVSAPLPSAPHSARALARGGCNGRRAPGRCAAAPRRPTPNECRPDGAHGSRPCYIEPHSAAMRGGTGRLLGSHERCVGSRRVGFGATPTDSERRSAMRSDAAQRSAVGSGPPPQLGLRQPHGCRMRHGQAPSQRRGGDGGGVSPAPGLADAAVLHRSRPALPRATSLSRTSPAQAPAACAGVGGCVRACVGDQV